MIDLSLKLIEKKNKLLCGFFGQFIEKFESNNLTIVQINTLKKYEAFRFIYDCLDGKFFSNQYLNKELDKFTKNNYFESLTYVKFENYSEKDSIEVLLDQLFKNSKEINNQKDTLIIELPTTENKVFDLKTKFSKTFISNNKDNKNLLFFTNEKSLIELYEKI